MAAQDPKSALIGLNVQVKLVHPPVSLRGTVNDIVSGVSLTLVNVWNDNGQWYPKIDLDARNVAGIEEVAAQAAQGGMGYGQLPIQQPAIQQAPIQQRTTHQAPPPAVQTATKSAFVDPAILSMGKPPRVAASPQVVQNVASMPIATQQPLNGQVQSVATAQKQATQSVFVSGVDQLFKSMAVSTPPTQAAAGPGAAIAPSPQTIAPGAKLSPAPKSRRKDKSQQGSRGAEPTSARSSVGPSKTSTNSSGWRETPILESTASFQPFATLKPQNGRRRRRRDDDNGWASEDVTDVQEAGEYDFESSNAKFDKNGVFDKIRQDDRIDEADRLVSHNRLPKPKPGTNGGKNLHYTENVLDPPPSATKTLPDDFWKSEAEVPKSSTGERHSGRELSSRQGSKRGDSKVSTSRRSQSRKASTATVVPDGRGGVVHTSSFDRSQQSTAGFYTIPGNRRVEILSPLQMLNLENIAQNDLGLSEDSMTENAGRGLAEAAIHTLSDPAIKLRASASQLKTHTIVILAGNNKSGCRAIAAARHLQARSGINVLLCVVGAGKGDRDLSVGMSRQVQLYKNFGGRVYTKNELFEQVRRLSIPVIDVDAPRSVQPKPKEFPISLVVDALLGHALPYEELRTADQAVVYELIEWTNRLESFVLSVDVPSGLDHATGIAAIQDGVGLCIRPRYVVSIGAPKKGLFEAIAASAEAQLDDQDNPSPGKKANGEAAESSEGAVDWKLFLLDIGLGAAVWKRAGTKIRRGIDFGQSWALSIRYRSGTEETGT